MLHTVDIDLIAVIAVVDDKIRELKMPEVMKTF